MCVYIYVCGHRHKCVYKASNIKMFKTAYSKYYMSIIRGLEVLLRNSNILLVAHTINNLRDHLNLRNDVHYTSCPVLDSSHILHGIVLVVFVHVISLSHASFHDFITGLPQSFWISKYFICPILLYFV